MTSRDVVMGVPTSLAPAIAQLLERLGVISKTGDSRHRKG